MITKGAKVTVVRSTQRAKELQVERLWRDQNMYCEIHGPGQMHTTKSCQEMINYKLKRIQEMASCTVQHIGYVPMPLAWL
uniref:Uncharacterized protein n=1 Tax=Arundo donax TaxID=35708 RepID=A0A0A9DRT6_ARUDO